MKFNIDEAFLVCGNENKYQRIVLAASMLTWLSVNYIQLVSPLMNLEPDYYCKVENEFNICSKQEFCSLSADNVKRIIQYKDIITDFQIDCNTFYIIFVGVLYIIGNIMGSLTTSFMSDIIGRKPVLIYSASINLISCLIFLFSPNFVFFLIGLFLIGIGNAGGCLVTFMYISEVISPEKRSLYSISLNIFFAFSGMSYFLLFQYSKNWNYLTCYSISFTLIILLIFIFYFVESPRFYYSNNEFTLSLRQFNYIAKKNNRQEEFRKFLKTNFKIFVQTNSLDFFYKLNKAFQSSLNINKVNPSSNNYIKVEAASQGPQANFINKLVKDSTISVGNNNDIHENIFNNFINEDDKNTIHHASEIDEILYYLEHYEGEKSLDIKKTNQNKVIGQEDTKNEFYYNNSSNQFIGSNHNHQTYNFIDLPAGDTPQNDHYNNNDKTIPFLSHERDDNIKKIDPFKAENNNYNNKEIGNKSGLNVSDNADKSWSENSSLYSTPGKENLGQDENFYNKNKISNEKNFNDSNQAYPIIKNDIKQQEDFNYIPSESCLKLNYILKKDFTNKLSLRPRRRRFQTNINYLPLIQNKSIKKEFFICSLIWITYGFTYYSVSLILKKGKKEIFFDMYIIAAAEIISLSITFFIIRSKTFGRVRALNIMLIIAGISSLFYYFMNLYSYGVLKIIALFATRFGISAIRSIIYTYSTELYPTVIRAKGLGINLLSSRIAACLVPVMIELFKDVFIYLGGICLFVSVFSFFLPETNNKKLQDDFD